MEGRTDIRGKLDELPLGAVCDATTEVDAWVVGGVVRDLLRGASAPPDVDIAVDGELEPVLGRLEAAGLDVEATHSRFETATVRLGDVRVDLSRTRSETYPRAGALPVVRPAGIDADLERRDFTVNAMAVPLTGDPDLLDPTGGVADLGAGVLRVLHDASFTDDPTRAIRAARYASRLGLEPDPHTLELLAGADLRTVSADRSEAELARLAAEPTAPAGLRMLADWGVLALDGATLDLIARIDELAGAAPWSAEAGLRRRGILLALSGGETLDRARAIGVAEPERPSEGVRLASGREPAELLVAAATGASWPADYMERWRTVGLEIDGEDLLAAGIPRGPAIGAGLQGALERKLDGGLTGGREAELELAIELARRSI